MYYGQRDKNISVRVSSQLLAESQKILDSYQRKCPFCGKIGGATEFVNLLCECGAKYYYKSDVWKDRKTGKEVRGRTLEVRNLEKMNKQIEEMAQLIRGTDHRIYQAGGSFILEQVGITHSQTIAEAFYNAGYRKLHEARWKGAGLGDYSCSLCGDTYSGGDEYNFCPNCGAKMKGEQK